MQRMAFVVPNTCVGVRIFAHTATHASCSVSIEIPYRSENVSTTKCEASGPVDSLGVKRALLRLESELESYDVVKYGLRSICFQSKLQLFTDRMRSR